MTLFVVYVNHRVNKARVHRSTCSFFKKRIHDTENGYWKISFDTFKEAMNFAKRTGKKNISSCSFCISKFATQAKSIASNEIYCTNCGKNVQSDWKVCPHCSAKI